jgi:hypothetical protein
VRVILGKSDRRVFFFTLRRGGKKKNNADLNPSMIQSAGFFRGNLRELLF